MHKQFQWRSILNVFGIVLWTLTEGKPGYPSMISVLPSRVRSAEECIRTSRYNRPQKGFVCKDMGTCYQYQCGAIARHCSSCGDESKGPCIDYGAESAEERAKRSADENTEQLKARILSDLTRLNSPDTFVNRLKVTTVEPAPLRQRQPVLIEIVGNAIVHLRVGTTDCAGFVALISGEDSDNYAVLTAAQCVTRFEVECSSERMKFGSKFEADPDSGEMVDGFMTYQYNHSSPCFGDYDAVVSKVVKGFKSYTVVVTSYNGLSFTFPLNSKHVIVSRDYIECQDCRNDFAAIKIDKATALSILHGAEPFVLSPTMNPVELESENIPNFVAVKAGYQPTRLRRATDVNFCTINHATKQKMCFNLPVPPMDSEQSKNLLPGTPLFLTQDNGTGRTEYHCIGIFTGYYTTFTKNFSVEELGDTNPPTEDNRRGDVPSTSDVDDLPSDNTIQLSFTKNGAVRITQEIVSFLRKILRSDSRKEQDEKAVESYPRHDCYPKLENPEEDEDKVCLCSLGWTGEGFGCKQDIAELAEGCSWDGTKFACIPRMRTSLREGLQLATSNILQRIVIAGTAKHLDLRGQGLHDIVELAEAMRHLTWLQDLFLDYNELEVLPAHLFEDNPELRMLSLRHNRLRLLDRDIFRFNKKLISVNLANNQLITLPSSILRFSVNLQYVSFQNNKLIDIHPRMFQKNSKLAKLYLGSNNLERCPVKLLRAQGLLTELWMNQNNLKGLPSIALKYCTKLRLADFSSNLITSIPRGLFYSNSDLRFVNLNDNKLSIVPTRLFSRNDNIMSISILRNPLASPNKTRINLERLGIPIN